MLTILAIVGGAGLLTLGIIAAVSLALALFAYGPQAITTDTVQPTRVSADGEPLYKAGGITIDWATVAVLAADLNAPDGSVVKATGAQKVLRYGQVLTKITASGKFGPYDPAAGDGRQLMARGDAVILDMTVVLFPAGATFPAENDIIGMGIEGGAVWIDRVLQSGVAAHTLALGPTLAEVLALFPLIQVVRN
jgi:hypothetical protein